MSKPKDSDKDWADLELRTDKVSDSIDFNDISEEFRKLLKESRDKAEEAGWLMDWYRFWNTEKPKQVYFKEKGYGYTIK